MARFFEIKTMNTELKRNEAAKQINHSIFLLQRQRNDVFMLFLQKFHQMVMKVGEKPQMKTSNEMKWPQITSKT